MLATLDWDSFVAFEDINDSVECIGLVISGLLGLSFPSKRICRSEATCSVHPGVCLLLL